MAKFAIALALIDSIWELKELSANIKEQFSHGVGTYNVSKVRLDIIEGSKPVFCKPRPVPLAWRDEVENKLSD